MGYLFFNPPGTIMVPVFISSFCIIAACRAFNNLYDKKEDVINRKTINPLTEKKGGLLIISCLLLVGFILSSFVSVISMFFYIIAALLGIIYSPLRLKSFFLVKNVFSGIILSFVFLIGTGVINIEVMLYFSLVFFFVFALSIVSDLMDHEGDKKAGLRTVPVVLGSGKTRILLYLLLLMFSFLTFHLRLFNLLVFSVFSLLAILFILTGRMNHVQKLVGLSTILTVVILALGIGI